MTDFRRMVLRGTILLACFACFSVQNVFGQNINITTNSPLPNGVVGDEYSLTLSATGGGGGGRTWQIVSGSLPQGLSLSTAGVISGTPTLAGNSSFRVQVATAQASREKNFTLRVNTPIAILSGPSLANGTQGATYSQVLTGSGGTTPYTWSISSGSLPNGLSVSSGTLAGSPTQTGTFNFTVRITDRSSPSQTTTKAMTIVVAALTITTASPRPAGVPSTPYSQSLTATNGVAPHSFSITSGSLPAGLTLDNGIISGTPTTTGTSNFTVRVDDSSVSPINTQKQFSLQIVPALTITTTSPLNSAFISVAYSQTLAATGGTGPYTFSLVSGTLPSGLALNGATISGTPTATGTSNFTIRVKDSNTPAVTTDKAFSIDVGLPLSSTVNSVLNITSASFPAGSTGVAYSQTLAATGGTAPFSWSIITGSLPPGLSLNGNTITGTPTTVTTASFTVGVADSSTPQQAAQRALSISVVAPFAVAAVSSLPNGAAGLAYSQTLVASGGTPPLTWSITAGTLPAGLTLSTGGVLAGTPTQTGTFNFTASVTDSSSPVRITTPTEMQLIIESLLTITTPSVPNGAAGSSYSIQLQASADGPVTWSLASGNLPPGISLSSAGLLIGTPTTTGTFSFTVRALSETPTQESTRTYQFVVGAALSMTTTTTPQATRFVPYMTTLVAAGGVTPYAWTLVSGGFPAGLSLSSTGVISGTPTTVGTSNFSVRVADAGGATVSRGFSIGVLQGVLQITTPTLPGGIQGFAYSQQLEASGGPTPFTWTIVSGTLPSGFTLTPAGVLQGNATAAFTGTISVRVTDSAAATATRDFTLVIGASVGTPALNGLPAKVSPAQQIPLTLSIPSAFPAELQGTLSFTFVSSAVIPVNDPAVQFSTGGRTVNFTIPANTTNAVFSAPLRLVTGTVAGTVTMTGAIKNGPSNIALTTTSIESIAPQMTSLTATRITGGLSVRVIGYSPERRVTEVEYSFDVRVNGVIEKINLGRSVLSEFNTWYQNQASTPFGSAFRMEQLFSVVGTSSAIEAVTVTLKNSQGGTTSARIPFTAN